MELLRSAVVRVRAAGYLIANVDLTVICERPRIGPHSNDIRRSLAAALDVRPSDVSVKGKTNEGMGWEGRDEGLAVHAVALLRTA
jgi:2-C-methyl-D-erythritol 2,4-cyclodiphosphate synthase